MVIDHIRLRNFKCFRDETLRFGGLTVLSGLNGAGKSSVIQAVLALRQYWAARRERRGAGLWWILGRFMQCFTVMLRSTR